MPHTGNAPSLTKHKKFRIVAIILIAILLIFIFVSKEKERKARRAELQAQAQVEFRNKLEKFVLPPCDNDECTEVLTVDAGPGTEHRLRGNTPYRAISVQSDGKRIIYNMPSGWETWTGAAPAGKLRLLNVKGAKAQALVEVLRVQ